MMAKGTRVLGRGGIGAGAGAALVMIAVMALLRFTSNTPSIPELMEERLTHLAGGQLESFFINNLGVGGKALLLVIILEGTLALGALLGWLFARFWPVAVGRWPSGLLYGGLIGLALNVILLPLVDYGFFGLDPSATAVRVTAPQNISRLLYNQDLAPIGVPVGLAMFILSLAFGLALVALLKWPHGATAGTGVQVAPVAASSPLDRRQFMTAGAGALLAGVALWFGITTALTPPKTALLIEGDQPTPEPDSTEVPQTAENTPTQPTQAQPTPSQPTQPAATQPPAAGNTVTAEPPTTTPQPAGTAEVPTTAGPTEAAPVGSPTEVAATEVPATAVADMPPTVAPTTAPTAPPSPTVPSAFAGVKPVLVPEVTPTENFYITTKNYVDPTVDGNTWQLRFKGLVDAPYTMNLRDLQALPVVNRIETLACISNPVGGDLIGNARWKGVSFRDLLQKAKPKKGATEIIVRGADGYSDSFSLEAALNNECVLAYEMNGAPLTAKHGFPARLLVPGIFGMKNCKWITEVELVNYDYKGFWEDQGWSDPAPYQTFSRIDYPSDNRITAKPIYIGGVAWAGLRGIKRVEVSVDKGKTWADATLRPALGKHTWVLWTFPWDAQRGDYTILVRATDGTGALQDATERNTFPDGATGYHSRQVRVG